MSKEKEIKQDADIQQEKTEETSNVNVDTDVEQQHEKTIEEDPVTKLSAQIAELQEQIRTLKDDRLRIMAEFENFRKNKSKEIASLRNVLADSFFKDMLPIIDDFERAMLSIEKATDVESLKEGTELIYRKFLSYLEKNGVTPIDTDNADFDTNLHEAIAVLPATSEEQKNKIIDCTTRGYKHGETVIRHAKVVVGQ